MKIYTLADIRNLGPCYNPACYELIRYLPEAWSGTLVDVLDCTACPPKDRIWVAVRLLPAKQIAAFAQDCAAAAQRYADKAKRTDWVEAAARAADWAEWAEVADWAAEVTVAVADLAAVMAAARKERDRQIEALKRLAREVV